MEVSGFNFPVTTNPLHPLSIIFHHHQPSFTIKYRRPLIYLLNLGFSGFNFPSEDGRNLWIPEASTWPQAASSKAMPLSLRRWRAERNCNRCWGGAVSVGSWLWWLWFLLFKIMVMIRLWWFWWFWWLWWLWWLWCGSDVGMMVMMMLTIWCPAFFFLF